MELIRCPRCAREIPEASRFCRRCGCAIAWRIGPPPDVAPLPTPPRRSTTVEKPVARRVPVTACRTSSGGGSGIFTLFAVAVFIFFARHHATMRPMIVPRAPAAPVLPPPTRTTPSLQLAPMTLSPTPPAPPASYPTPLRSNSAESSRTRTGANLWIGPSEPPPRYQWDDDPRVRYDYSGRGRARGHWAERP